ncbi:MAG: hypothetical protein CMM07_25735 [Rhodopirellula sp.]|nr:hypothetical protein [Rhodopirellula sp.]
MCDGVYRGIFKGLVKRAGGVDVVAAIVDAEHGSCSKGTISKMCSGQAALTYQVVHSLEEFVGAFPITNRSFERTSREVKNHRGLPDLAAESAVLTGQAHATLIKAYSALSEDPTRVTSEERAEIIASMRAARQVMTEIIDAAEVVS